MLYLVVQSGPHRFALEACRLAEVVPLVRLEPIAGMPPAMAGSMRYRDTVSPVFDLDALLNSNLSPSAPAAPAQMSTRIVMLQDPAGPDRWLGFRVRKIVSMLETAPGQWQPAGLGLDHGGLVLSVRTDSAGMIFALDGPRLLQAAAATTATAPAPVPALAGTKPVSESMRPWITPTLRSF
jgi:chemotaxis-related protein WspB